MKLGMRGHDFGRMDIETLAKTIKGAGFDSVQLAPTKAIEGIEHFNDIKPKHLDDIAAAFNKAELDIRIYGCYIEPSLQDEAQRLEQVGYFIQGIKNCKAVGGYAIGTETTSLDVNAPADVREAAYQRLKDSVLRMVEVAEREAVLIAIEPVAEHVLNTPALAKRLLDEVQSEYLGIIFDPVNLVLPSTIQDQRQIYQSLFDLLGDKVAVLHMKDIDIENNEKAWRLIGKGLIDYPFIIDWLHKNKPDTHVLREIIMWDTHKQDLETMKKLTGGL